MSNSNIPPFRLDDKGWLEKYSTLKEYKKIHGHIRVKKKDSPSLSRWVGKQRTLNRDGRLQQDRKERLDRIGFVWTSGTCRNDARWLQLYKEVKEFKLRHGHTCIPRKRYLQSWMCEQRRRHEEGTLLKERRKLLREIGFAWKSAEDVSQAEKSKDIGRKTASESEGQGEDENEETASESEGQGEDEDEETASESEGQGEDEDEDMPEVSEIAAPTVAAPNASDAGEQRMLEDLSSWLHNRFASQGLLPPSPNELNGYAKKLFDYGLDSAAHLDNLMQDRSRRKYFDKVLSSIVDMKKHHHYGVTGHEAF